MEEVSLKDRIKSITRKSVNQAAWQFDYYKWLENYSQKDMIENLPFFIIKLRTFKVGNVPALEELLKAARNNEISGLKKLREEQLESEL